MFLNCTNESKITDGCHDSEMSKHYTRIGFLRSMIKTDFKQIEPFCLKQNNPLSDRTDCH